MKKIYQSLALLALALPLTGQVNPKLQARLDQQARDIESRVIEWRRNFHQNPELGNREFKTGAKIAEHLKSLGIKVQYPVAATGMVGILEGGKPGPIIALRADMDALPITERNSLPFASTEKNQYLIHGRQVSCMPVGTMRIWLF